MGITADDSHICIQIGNQETTEVRLIPAADPTAAGPGDKRARTDQLRKKRSMLSNHPGLPVSCSSSPSSR